MTRDNQLDELDLKILDILQQNGRMETVHVANKVCRSPRGTLDRIERLVGLGFILRFTAILNRRLLGRPTMMVTMVKLKAHGIDILHEFADAMSRESEVQAVLHLSGEFDFLLQVTLRDAQEYEDFLAHKLCVLPMVDKVHSSLVLKECKMEPALPLC